MKGPGDAPPAAPSSTTDQVNQANIPAIDPAPPLKQLVPHLFQTCDTAIISQLVTEMISRLISHNDRIPLTSATVTRFHSRAPPGIKLDDYLRRIVKFASVEPSVVILLLVYIDRICEINPTFTISSLTVHRFIIAAVTAGSKALSDIYCTNTYYARVGGISLQELNLMEMEFCKMIGWKLSCSIILLQQYYANLVRTSPLYVLAPPPQQQLQIQQAQQ
ncbi:hypothetical protein PhCBS80983_g02958 [Powellomyces hirtus]|uniref:Cyclin n=1 Tax=Powellomyces hirtus TaxID=109895 RepID=A0A507E3Q6_9FUNG|nr:hypothetical protein PhCBS80983_g02958 [Powellomyces hirtus]